MLELMKMINFFTLKTAKCWIFVANSYNHIEGVTLKEKKILGLNDSIHEKNQKQGQKVHKIVT